MRPVGPARSLLLITSAQKNAPTVVSAASATSVLMVKLSDRCRTGLIRRSITGDGNAVRKGKRIAVGRGGLDQSGANGVRRTSVVGGAALYRELPAAVAFQPFADVLMIVSVGESAGKAKVQAAAAAIGTGIHEGPAGGQRHDEGGHAAAHSASR